ncbi:MAG: DUF2269 family protein [bacterium]|nr:DUF2269 family protein [bacterium]
MLLVKTLHVICAVLWLGNFVVTGVWSLRAFALRDAALARFATREILFTDLLFTFVGGSAVVMSGLGLAALEGISPWATAWTRGALLTSIASGIAWIALLLPIELRMRRLAEGGDDLALRKVFVWWNVVGWAITVALFSIIYLMVAKPV